MNSSKSAPIGDVSSNEDFEESLNEIPVEYLLTKEISLYYNSLLEKKRPRKQSNRVNGKKMKKFIDIANIYHNLFSKSPNNLKHPIIISETNPLSLKKPEESIQNIAYDEPIFILTLYLPLSISIIDSFPKTPLKSTKFPLFTTLPCSKCKRFF